MRQARRIVRSIWIVVGALLLVGSIVEAGVTVSLPFEGRFRAGRFMPVRVVTTDGPRDVVLRADGAVATVVEGASDGERIVPVLVVSESPKELRIEGAASIPLRALAENERLVAFAGADANSAKTLFPDAALIPVSLDVTGALLDPPLAWGGLDAVVLSPAARARLSEAQTGLLLAAGVALVVPDANRPDGRWPWQRSGDVWVLRHRVAGPAESFSPAAYSPTYTWDRGVPVASRRQIVLMAILFCICALAISLWRSRATTAAILLLCALTAAGVTAKYLWHPQQLMMQKSVAVRGTLLTQYDDWAWRAALREAHVSQPAYQLTVPVFASVRQIEESEIRLNCDAQGKPVVYTFRVGPEQSLAFVTRDVLPTFSVQVFAPAAAPWKDFAMDLYAAQGDQIAGEAQIADGLSATIVNRPE